MRTGSVFLALILSLLVTQDAQATEPAETYVFMGRAYGPEEYCNFGGGIPRHYVEICEKMKPESRQAAGARSDRAQRWIRLQADNGATFGVDIGDVGHPESGIVAVKMCLIDVDDQCVGGDSWVLASKLIWLDCRGHYADVTNAPSVSGWLVAPPDSVIGRASNLACGQETSPLR